jgi:hypothetical protein
VPTFGSMPLGGSEPLAHWVHTSPSAIGSSSRYDSGREGGVDEKDESSSSEKGGRRSGREAAGEREWYEEEGETTATD